MPVTWMGYTYVIHYNNGQCIIVLSTKVREGLPQNELYVRGIPREYGPEELVPIFSKPGVVHTIRLLMDFGQRNRGFAYVSYLNPWNIEHALSTMNGMPISRTQRLEMFKSRDIRTFKLCYVSRLCSVDVMYRTIVQVTRLKDITYEAILHGNTYDVVLECKTHNDCIHAFTKLNRVRHMFGPACQLKYFDLMAVGHRNPLA